MNIFEFKPTNESMGERTDTWMLSDTPFPLTLPSLRAPAALF